MSLKYFAFGWMMGVGIGLALSEAAIIMGLLLVILGFVALVVELIQDFG